MTYFGKEFSSFIYKESNVFDRTVSPNYEGLELLESKEFVMKCLHLNMIYGIFNQKTDLNKALYRLFYA